MTIKKTYRPGIANALQCIAACIVIAGILWGLWLLSQALMILIVWFFLFPTGMSILSGLIKGLMLKQWDVLLNALQLIRGNYIAGQEQDYGKGILTVISRLIWEQPQNMAGYIFMQLLNSAWLLAVVEHYKQATISQGNFFRGGGLALGSFILIDLHESLPVEVKPIDDISVAVKILIRHEYGHVLQSNRSGPIYLFKYGIPSIIRQGWTEKDAEFRSDSYLLGQEKIFPVFGSYRQQKKPFNVKILEVVIVIVAISGGGLFNDLYGAISGFLISGALIAVLNINKPL